MVSVEVKFRPSMTTDEPGSVYYQFRENRESKQVATKYLLYNHEWNSEYAIISIAQAAYHRRSYLQKIEGCIIKDMYKIQELISENQMLDIVIRDYYKFRNEHSLHSFAMQLERDLRGAGRIKTARSYKTTINSFLQFCQDQSIEFDKVDSGLIKQYERFLKSKPVCNNTISFYMRILRAIYNRAVNAKIVEQCFPFKGVYVGLDKTIKRAVGEDVVFRVKEFDLSGMCNLEFARDMFLFCFYARGMAYVDIAHLKKENVVGDYIVYRRHKTGQTLSIRIEPCLRILIARYADVAVDSERLFPILTGKEANYESALRLQNMHLKQISELMNLDIHLTSYVARHSWATLAKKKGVPTHVISESMGHNNEKTTFIYLASLDQSVVDKANAELLQGLG